MSNSKFDEILSWALKSTEKCHRLCIKEVHLLWSQVYATETVDQEFSVV